MAMEELTEQEKTQVGEALVKDDIITKEELDAAIEREERSGISRLRHIINSQRVPIRAIDEILHREFHSRDKRKADTKLGQTLLSMDAVSREHLRAALAEQKRTGRLLGHILLDRGIITPHVIVAALGKMHNMPVIDPEKEPVDIEALARVPESVAMRNHVLPLRIEEGRLVVAISDPRRTSASDTVRFVAGMPLSYVVAEDEALMRTIVKQYRIYDRHMAKQKPASIPKIKPAAAKPVKEPVSEKKENQPMKNKTGSDKPVEDRKRFETLSKAAQNLPVVSLVSRIVEGAINARATDIHLDPQRPEMRVRYRIDGILHDVMTIPERIEPAVISRIKILSDLDITETRRPQDGHFEVDHDDYKIDVRVATLPTHIGERIVLRLLDKHAVGLGFKELGLNDAGIKTLTELIKRPYGMILVTGPTGSGKTTTLYAALNQRNVISESIVTLEDPVEYELSGINQVKIDTNVDLTFPATLRAVLRQDPDTIMVGEIRDVETAQIAIRAAMTGHLVLSTLHTNSAAEAIGTLYNMGVKPYLTAASLVAVVAQRLVRVICPHCRKRKKPTAAELKSVGLPPSTKSIYVGGGCDECFHTGYLGRTGIYEILTVTPKVRDLIIENATADQIAKSVRLKTMAAHCRDKVKKGETTVEEYLRVIG